MTDREQTAQIHNRWRDHIVFTGEVVIFTLVVAATLGCFASYASLKSAVAAVTVIKNDHVLIAIEGMHCKSCADGIKAMLKRTPGVVSAEVSFERREADVEYDPSRTSPERIVEAITSMGYKASVKEQREPEQVSYIIGVSARVAGSK